MAKLTLFMFPECPHCQLALKLIAELQSEPQWQGVEVELVNERVEVERAEAHDYYYVPTFYLGAAKLHEGHAERADIERVFAAAASQPS